MRFVIAFAAFVSIASAFTPMKRISALHMRPNQLLATDNLCQACQDFVTTLKPALSSPAITEDLSKALSYVCEQTSDFIQKELCSLITTVYAPYALENIANFVNPEHLCEETFKVCPAKPKANQIQFSAVTLPPQEISDIECAACNWGVVFVTGGLMNQDDGNALGWEINKFCINYMPANSTEMQKCQGIAEQISEILPFLQTILTPEKVCQGMIKVCPTSSSDKKKIIN